MDINLQKSLDSLEALREQLAILEVSIGTLTEELTDSKEPERKIQELTERLRGLERTKEGVLLDLKVTQEGINLMVEEGTANSTDITPRSRVSSSSNNGSSTKHSLSSLRTGALDVTFSEKEQQLVRKLSKEYTEVNLTAFEQKLLEELTAKLEKMHSTDFEDLEELFGLISPKVLSDLYRYVVNIRGPHPLQTDLYRYLWIKQITEPFEVDTREWYRLSWEALTWWYRTEKNSHLIEALGKEITKRNSTYF